MTIEGEDTPVGILLAKAGRVGSEAGGKGGRKPLLTVGSGGGLDQFTLGDIRKAEKTLEESHMSLGQYARKVAQGEITKTTDDEEK
ncbi:hypothetical protein Pmar_PMAR007997, partial [Perkinsus marinus ATCC 50983]